MIGSKQNVKRQNAFSRLFDLKDSAMLSWKSITKEFVTMRNPERFSNEICDLKQKISSANKPNDII